MHITPQWPFPSENINDIRGIFYRIRLIEKTGRFEKNVNVSDISFAV